MVAEMLMSRCIWGRWVSSECSLRWMSSECEMDVLGMLVKVYLGAGGCPRNASLRWMSSECLSFRWMSSKCSDGCPRNARRWMSSECSQMDVLGMPQMDVLGMLDGCPRNARNVRCPWSVSNVSPRNVCRDKRSRSKGENVTKIQQLPSRTTLTLLKSAVA
jgi:hypothetical protein